MADPAADGLIYVATFRTVTGDTTTPSGQVEAALDAALDMAEEYLNRKLAYGVHTETLYVYRDGKVYPTNTPIASVSSPAVAATAIQGAGVYLGTFIPTPEIVNVGDWQAAVPPQAAMTYEGGYQPEDVTNGPTPPLPVTLNRAICRIAWNVLHPAVLPGVPAGAKSAAVGDVSMTGDLSAFVAISPSIERDLKPYRKGRQAHAWQRA